MQACREFEFSDKEFSLMQELVRVHTGIHLSEQKQDLVYGRLSRRLRALGLKSFQDYCKLIETGHQGELEKFTNAITTNLTSFFRESHHFDFLATHLIPQLIKNNAQSRRLRIWSAGCSTGEEPYSIAIALKEAVPKIDSWDARILATDLDSDVIDKAISGIYSSGVADKLSKQRLNRWFMKGSGNNKGKVKIIPEVSKLITFKQLNLMHDWPMQGSFDIIFCRNVVIYFDKPTQEMLFDRFANILTHNGKLFVGHSESLFKTSKRFKLIDKTVYVKTT